MKKDLEWLKSEVGKIAVETSCFYPYHTTINKSDIIHIIDQLDEPEVLSQELPEELEKILAYEPHDPIKPKHYRKGEIDLYESAYRTRPFNEFRAIMEFIAERYMKRDKDNRIQDLDKAIYTVNRLKEYEEMEEEE